MEKGGQEVPVALCTTLCHSFHFGGGGDRKRRKEEEEDRPLLACQELSHNPQSDLRRTVLSLTTQPPPSLPPPSSSKCFFTPLPANLHYSPLLPPSFLSHLPPSSVAGATLSGTADRYVNWAGALTRTACKIILGAAKRQVIKLNFRPVDLIGTGN